MRKHGSLVIIFIALGAFALSSCSSGDADSAASSTTDKPTTTVSREAAGSATDVAADCTQANPGQDLHGCDLTNTALQYRDLTGANLTGTNLTGAHLENAILTGAILTGVIWSNTTCPNGVVQSTQCPRTSAG